MFGTHTCEREFKPQAKKDSQIDSSSKSGKEALTALCVEPFGMEYFLKHKRKISGSLAKLESKGDILGSNYKYTDKLHLRKCDLSEAEALIRVYEAGYTPISMDPLSWHDDQGLPLLGCIPILSYGYHTTSINTFRQGNGVEARICTGHTMAEPFISCRYMEIIKKFPLRYRKDNSDISCFDKLCELLHIKRTKKIRRNLRYTTIFGNIPEKILSTEEDFLELEEMVAEWGFSELEEKVVTAYQYFRSLYNYLWSTCFYIVFDTQGRWEETWEETPWDGLKNISEEAPHKTDYVVIAYQDKYDMAWLISGITNEEINIPHLNEAFDL